VDYEAKMREGGSAIWITDLVISGIIIVVLIICSILIIGLNTLRPRNWSRKRSCSRWRSLAQSQLRSLPLRISHHPAWWAVGEGGIKLNRCIEYRTKGVERGK